MDKPKTTAKDFFLWTGAMVTFYWSTIAFILLTFDYINYSFPNALSYYPADPYQSGISYEMASIIVLFPIYLLLMKLIHGNISRDPSRNEIWVRRWALILTLFVAGVAIAVDLIMLLTTFLNGEALTIAFLLKVLIIFLVAAGVFMHFIADLKGYWDTFPARRNMVRIGVAVLAVATIGSGFFIVGTPAEARLARFDAQKVSDLQNIQSQVVYYWQAKRALPATITDLNNSLNYGPIPVDPETGASYEYQSTGALSFKLCATFNAQSRGNQNAYSETRVLAPMPVDAKGMLADNWQHSAGTVCFDRTIDPSFYPPLKN
ncbi:hypothetical protein A2950_01515 [Candidatus Kaiserbacteria bacterium RIFCSPLOWO2_01_FULL_55_19]|uniref:DUF5671 domain-containing protein n=1 Tax=Candidatus Kaiserbacteria bacterium RIFCSPLOWO2_01_FULL_55_19 TaxID=1798516 RepID=A0A1F6ERL6_9BACT|nr:MAG: hypothetical protein A2950_01515 [Candidatus Kaiserbacteria bacterium RIFCSPLOWO2_01_FULL_55_19]